MKKHYIRQTINSLLDKKTLKKIKKHKKNNFTFFYFLKKKFGFLNDF